MDAVRTAPIGGWVGLGYFAQKSRAAVTARHKRSSKRSGKSLSRARSRTTALFAEYPRERPNKSTPSDVAGCLHFYSDEAGNINS